MLDAAKCADVVLCVVGPHANLEDTEAVEAVAPIEVLISVRFSHAWILVVVTTQTSDLADSIGILIFSSTQLQTLKDVSQRAWNTFPIQSGPTPFIRICGKCLGSKGPHNFPSAAWFHKTSNASPGLSGKWFCSLS